MVRAYICYILLLLLPTGLSAQFKNQKFYHLTRTDGLSQSTINSIVKDAEGFMWFGVRDGLNRYDGYSFTHYKHDPLDENSLGLGRVNTLFVDSKQRLWVGTDQGGLNLFIPEKDNFKSFNKLSDEGEVLSDVRQIIETRDNLLVIASYGHGLLLLNPETGQFNRITGNQYTDISALAMIDKKLFFGTPKGVGYLEGPLTKLLVNSPVYPLTQLPEVEVLNLFTDSEKNLWIGTYGSGAFKYFPGQDIIQAYSTHESASYELSHNIVRSITEYPHGTILIGTGGGGIDIIDKKGMVQGAIKHQLNYPRGINTNIIYSFYNDDVDNLWIGTYNGGVNVLYNNKDKFVHLKSYGRENDLSANAVLAIEENKEGKLWIGTDGGGLDLYDPKNDSFTNFQHIEGDKQSLSGNVVKTLFLDSRNILWIGTFTKGLNSYNPVTNRFKQYLYDAQNPDGIGWSHIWDITEDASGNIWLATLGGGLDMLDVETGNFRHFRNQPQNPNSISSDMLSSLLIDSEGSLWVGTEFGGVCKLIDKNKGVFKVYNRTQEEDLISSNHITVLFEDSRKNIWAGTIGGGLNLFIPEENRFKSFTESDGLASNLVFALLEDSQGNLWISTNNGISRFLKAVELPDEPKFINYNVGDGLQSKEFSTKAACKTQNGLLYFGGIEGINIIDPDNIGLNNHVPPVVITDFKIFNQSIDFNKPGAPLDAPILHTDKVTLSYKQSVITFEFAALDFTMPSENKYKYKLEGFETQWNEVGNKRTATYTNLNPGKYKFRVIGSNNDDVWNFEGTSVELVILPPFWKRWDFRILVFVILILGIIFLYRQKVSSIEKNRKMLKKLVDERTQELVKLNEILGKQNTDIQNQRAKLQEQKENLLITNSELEKKQQQIQEQNKELENHRHNLEELVLQRTAELEKAKQRAEESDHLKSSFLSNMSHEIRTPLNAIVGFSALLGESDLSEDERLDFKIQIERNSETLLVLIDDILDLSRIESNQLNIEPGDIDLDTFIDELYETFMLKTKPGLELIKKNTLQNRGIVFHTDPTRLRQILTNLLDNSIKFTERGSVELGVSEKDEWLKFHVIDTGIGMSKEILDKIYDRFFKSEINANKIYRGTGLGLTITRKLVEILKGKISVKSKEGAGTSFEVLIPRKL